MSLTLIFPLVRRASGAPYGSDLITGAQTYTASIGANPENAADNNTGTTWATGNFNSTSHWWKVQFPVQKFITKVELANFVADGAAGNTLFVEGSNDDSAWTTISTQANEPSTNASLESYEFSNLNGYLFYRVRIARTTLGNINVQEFQMYECI